MARILWADDEIESLKPHLLFLENKGFEVTAVNSGVEAIEKVSESKSDSGIKNLEIELKYVNGEHAIRGLSRLSKPGRRSYCGYREIPRTLGGLGISILSTPQGIMDDKSARKNKLGGELLCSVW